MYPDGSGLFKDLLQHEMVKSILLNLRNPQVQGLNIDFGPIVGQVLQDQFIPAIRAMSSLFR